MAQTVFPCLTFRDAKTSIEWLERDLGAEVTEPVDKDFSRDLTVTDPDGNRWSLGTYAGHQE